MANSQPVVGAFKRALRDSNASPKVRKALLEAGIVESHLQNLSYGDRDSVGPLQQRPSQGWHNARNPYKAALDFIRQAQPLAGKYASAGELAQAVQRSAYPGRYQQHSGEAQALLRGGSYGKGSYSNSVSKALTPPDNKAQIALGLLGFGGLGGYGGGDPLTSALLQAKQGTPTTPVKGPQPTATDVRSIASRATAISREHLPYQWGGGHGATPAGPGVPVDCSGAVSRLLGVKPRVSGDYTKFGQAGKGRNLTIYANGQHVLMGIRGRDGVEHFWGTSATNPSGGAGWIPRSQISPQYLKGFVARHPAGQ
jgi:hypothetical protein